MGNHILNRNEFDIDNILTIASDEGILVRKTNVKENTSFISRKLTEQLLTEYKKIGYKETDIINYRIGDYMNNQHDLSDTEFQEICTNIIERLSHLFDFHVFYLKKRAGNNHIFSNESNFDEVQIYKLPRFAVPSVGYYKIHIDPVSGRKGYCRSIFKFEKDKTIFTMDNSNSPPGNYDEFGLSNDLIKVGEIWNASKANIYEISLTKRFPVQKIWVDDKETLFIEMY